MRISFNIETANLPDGDTDALVSMKLVSVGPDGEWIRRENLGDVERDPEVISDRAGAFVRAEVLKYLTMVDNSEL